MAQSNQPSTPAQSASSLPTTASSATASSATASPSNASSTNGAGQQAARATAELLRWRADILMDEMMLGAADLSASDGDRSSSMSGDLDASSAQSQAPSSSYPPSTTSPNGRPTSNTPFDAPNRPQPDWRSGRQPARDSVSAARSESERYENQLSSYANQAAGSFASPDQNYQPRGYSPQAYQPPQPGDAPPSATLQNAAPQNATPQNAAENAQLLPADRRYRSPQPGSVSPYEATPAASAQSAPQAAPQFNAQDSAPVPALGPVRVTPSARFANSMTVGPRANQYSTLLPRSSQMDARAVQLELATLTDQVEVRLPPGHDVHVRARHLLDKAREIVGDGGDRGVEIEYYLQQVRAIVERASQRIGASAIYRARLVRYMLAWAALALVVISGLLVYQSLLERTLVARTTLTADGLVLRNVVALGIALASGVLGSALGALANMRRHSRKEYGFFDRKYSTLGLILPIIGLVVSLVIYLLCVPVFMLFDLNLLTNRLLVIFPVALAFLFGYLQENIYGTNE